MRRLNRWSSRGLLRASAAIAALAAVPGCLSPDVAMSHKAHERPHITMRDPETGQVLQVLTKVQLQNRLFDLCDLWASLIKNLYDPMIDDVTDPEIRSSLIEQKLRSIVSGYTIGVTSDPVSGMLDMMVLSRLLATMWSPGPRATDWFGDLAPRVSAGLAAADVKIWKIGGQLLSPGERKQLEERIERWIADSPDLKSVSFARLSDIDSGFDAKLEAEVAKSQGLLDVIDEAMRSAEEFRLLGERSLWIASRAPILLRMTTEASIVSAFDIPQVQEALNSTHALPVAVDHLAERIHEAAASVDQQRRDIFASLDKARDSVQPVLKQVTEVIDRAESVVKEARRLSSERSEAAEAAAAASKDLREALTTLNTMADRFFPVNSTGKAGELSHTTADLALAADRFHSAVVTLQTLAKPGEASNAIADLSKFADAKVASIAASGDAAIDRAFWRGLVLIVAAFVLAVFYKLISPRLARS